MASDSPRDSVRRARYYCLVLGRDEEIVVARVEALFFVGYIEVVAVVWDLLDEGPWVCTGVIVVRHRAGGMREM